MRIVHLTNSIDPVSGGPANVLARLAPVQVSRGHAVTVITADTPETVRDITATLAASGVTVHAGGPKSGPIDRCPGAIDHLRSVISSGVDLIHGVGLL